MTYCVMEVGWREGRRKLILTQYIIIIGIC